MPCGFVVDHLRSCYRSAWRLWPDDPERTIEGVYYWAPMGAPPFPYPHPYGSQIWRTGEEDTGGLGELLGHPMRWRNGARPRHLVPPPTLLGPPDCYLSGGRIGGDPAPHAAAGVDCRCWTFANRRCPEAEMPVRTQDAIVKFGEAYEDLTDSRGVDTGAGRVVWDAPLESEYVACRGRAVGPTPAAGLSQVWFGLDGFGRVTYPGGPTEALGYEAVVEHVGLADPHAQYLLRSELPLVLESGGSEADLSATGPGIVVQPSAGAPLEVVPARSFIPGLSLGYSYIATSEAVPHVVPAPMPTPDAVSFSVPDGSLLVVELDAEVTPGATNQTWQLYLTLDGDATALETDDFRTGANLAGQHIRYWAVLTVASGTGRTLTVNWIASLGTFPTASRRLLRVYLVG